MKISKIFEPQSVRSFFQSMPFGKALVLTLGILAAIMVFSMSGKINFGISMAIGILLSSASDVPGRLQIRIKAILYATLLMVIATIAISLANAIQYLLVPVLVLMMFLLSYLAVFGFRASLISFSGLLATVLAMAGISETPMFLHAGLIGCGGLFYLCLSLMVHFLNPKKQTDHLLADCFELTAEYIRIRSKLLSEMEKREELREKLIFLQNDLNEKHETLRELLISARRASGASASERQRLYIFIELIDILELAMANPVDYERMDIIFQNEKKLLAAYQEFGGEMADYLEKLSEAIRNSKKWKEKQLLTKKLGQVENEIFHFEKRLKSAQAQEAVLILQNMYLYLEKQHQKLGLIGRLVRKTANLQQFNTKDAERFLTPQEYSWSIFRENFNFKSPIFKHSLRLTITILIGFLVGQFLELQNVYWILLTIIVILRPNYGLTKERSQQRIVGTLFGAVVAAAIVFLVQNEVVYAILGVVSFLFAFSLVQTNYKWAAGFITLNVVFLYALLMPNAFNVIQFRVLDTIIGAGLAYFGILLLFPSWEYKSIEKFFAESIKANKEYLKEIQLFYKQKKQLPTSYKLARKGAFLAMGNLSAAFQRMTQEPKRQQKNLAGIYEIVVLNQTFLSSAASLGTYIQNHATTAATPHFDALVMQIRNNLNQALANLEEPAETEKANEEDFLKAQDYLNKKYSDLVFSKSKNEDASGEAVLQLQEVQLLKSQLSWLLDVSEKLKKQLEQQKQTS